MRNYYGQRGDDFLLWLPYLSKVEPGYFVEVGALDGKRFSNTFSFEEQGWTGICVEAHPDYIKDLEQNRPNSYIVFAAAGDYNGTTTFYTNSRGSLSTLDPTQEKQFKKYGKYFTGFTKVEVPLKTLTQILEDANAPKIIDILSIDVEGAEMRVLSGMDWDKYIVQIIIIEASADEEANMDAFFTARKYYKSRRYHSNLIYCRNEQDAQMIASADVQCTTIHTPHKLDDNSEPILVQIDTSNSINSDHQDRNHKSLHQPIKQLLSKVKFSLKRLLSQ